MSTGGHLKAMLDEAIDNVCAGMGWCEMGDQEKTTATLKRSIGLIHETQRQLDLFIRDVEGTDGGELTKAS